MRSSAVSSTRGEKPKATSSSAECDDFSCSRERCGVKPQSLLADRENRRLQLRHAGFHSHLPGAFVQRNDAHHRSLTIEGSDGALTQQRFGAHDGFHGKIGNVDTGKHVNL